MPGPVAPLVASPTADPRVRSSIPAWPYTFVEINHEIFSTVILHLPLIQEGLLSVTSESMCTEYWLIAWSKLALEKKVWLGLRLTDHLNMTIDVDLHITTAQVASKQNDFCDLFIKRFNCQKTKTR